MSFKGADLIGQKYGRFVVIDYEFLDKEDE